MAYDAGKHNLFARRCQNWIRMIQNGYEEAGKINDIYVNETVSGTDPAFDDVNTNIAEEAELTEAINLMLRLRDMLALDGQSQIIAVEDQTARMTPFLQEVN